MNKITPKVQINSKSQRKFVRFAITATTSFLFITLLACFIIPKLFKLNLIGYQTLKLQIVTCFSFCCLYAQMIYTALFILSILAIWYRYKKLNELLNAQLPISAGETIKILSKLHLSTSSAITSINKIFSIPIMISFGFNISSGVFSLYELISVLSIADATIQQIGFCFMVNSWLPCALISTVIEVVCCMTAVSEGKRTAKHLWIKLSIEDDEMIRKKLKLFLLQIRHSGNRFSCGLFEFHWRSLGVVSMIVYLVLLGSFHFYSYSLVSTRVLSCTFVCF